MDQGPFRPADRARALDRCDTDRVVNPGYAGRFVGVLSNSAAAGLVTYPLSQRLRVTTQILSRVNPGIGSRVTSPSRCADDERCHAPAVASQSRSQLGLGELSVGYLDEFFR